MVVENNTRISIIKSRSGAENETRRKELAPTKQGSLRLQDRLISFLCFFLFF